MRLMKECSRNSTRDRANSLQSWRTLYHCITLILFWWRKTQVTENTGPWWMISSRIRNKIYWSLRLNAPETQQPHRGRQSELKKKAKNADLGRYKFKMPNKCSCEHDSAKKGKGRKTKILKSCFQRNFCWKAVCQKDGKEFVWQRRSTSVSELQEGKLWLWHRMRLLASFAL